MNKKSVWLLILSAIVAGVVVSWTNANMFGSLWNSDNKVEMRNNIEWKQRWWWRMWNREERQAESENRRVDREAHMWVIKKLIDWEELTSDEKIVLEEIKVKKAERKEEMKERHAKIEEFMDTMDKLLDWEELTDDEKAIIEDHRAHSWMKMWRRWFMHR